MDPKDVCVFIIQRENVSTVGKQRRNTATERKENVGRGVGGRKGEEVGRSKPKRMLSCVGMLLEFEFLVRCNSIHIVLFLF